jgi:predicted O-methyltransferase YrrM
MPHDEGLCLYQTVLEITVQGPIVEVGSYCGKSAIYLGAAAAETGSVVFTIDHHRGSEEMQEGWEHHDGEVVNRDTGRIDSLPALRRNLEETGLEGSVVPIVGDSRLVASHWDTPVSMVFIDGGHGPIPAHADYDDWASKIAPGGFLAIHDVFPDPADGGRPPYEIFMRAVNEGDFEEHAAVGSLRVLRSSR